MEYLALTLEQGTQAVDNELLNWINMATAVNAAQMLRINKWTTSRENAHSVLQLQMEAHKRSVDALAKELETVKKDQARQRAESIAQLVLTTVRSAAVRRGSLAHPTKFFQTSAAIKYTDFYATQM